MLRIKLFILDYLVKNWNKLMLTIYIFGFNNKC